MEEKRFKVHYIKIPPHGQRTFEGLADYLLAETIPVIEFNKEPMFKVSKESHGRTSSKSRTTNSIDSTGTATTG